MNEELLRKVCNHIREDQEQVLSISWPADYDGVRIRFPGEKIYTIDGVLLQELNNDET